MIRPDERTPEQVRAVRFAPGFLPYAEGSVLIELGNTRVVCAVSLEESVPPFLRGQGVGWVTAEYRMLPRATQTRTPRDSGGRVDGRSTEIQRLIGRSLRAAIDRTLLGERMLIVDCDVLTADGGTRTAAITGGFVALVLACQRLRAGGVISTMPIRRQVAAISAGIVGGVPVLDLAYAEDSIADVDCNAVYTHRWETVEFQLSAEHGLPGDDQVEEIRRLARLGVAEMLAAQRACLAEVAPTALDELVT